MSSRATREERSHRQKQKSKAEMRCHHTALALATNSVWSAIHSSSSPLLVRHLQMMCRIGLSTGKPACGSRRVPVHLQGHEARVTRMSDAHGMSVQIARQKSLAACPPSGVRSS